jgi:hypothetical protein
MKKSLFIIGLILLIVGCASFSLSNPFLGSWTTGAGSAKVEYFFGTGGMVKIVGPKVSGIADYEWDGDSLTLKYRTDSRILFYHYIFSKDHSQMQLKDFSGKIIFVLTKGK